MFEKLPEAFKVASSGAKITIERGFCTCANHEFEVVWNKGLPNVEMTEKEDIAIGVLKFCIVSK